MDDDLSGLLRRLQELIEEVARPDRRSGTDTTEDSTDDEDSARV